MDYSSLVVPYLGLKLLHGATLAGTGSALADLVSSAEATACSSDHLLQPAYQTVTET